MPGSCSMAVHIALNEVGADFQLVNVRISDGQNRQEKDRAEFLEANPRGSVPVLQINDFILREGAAILIYLLDSHKNSLLPQSGLDRARALEWLAFANSSLHPAYGRVFFLSRQLGAQSKDSPIYTAAIANIQKYWDEIEQHLAHNDYLCGQSCTIADILTTVIANWSPMLQQPINFGPKTKEFFAKIIARPAYKKALATEGVTYKVA